MKCSNVLKVKVNSKQNKQVSLTPDRQSTELTACGQVCDPWVSSGRSTSLRKTHQASENLRNREWTITLYICRSRQETEKLYFLSRFYINFLIQEAISGLNYPTCVLAFCWTRWRHLFSRQWAGPAGGPAHSPPGLLSWSRRNILEGGSGPRPGVSIHKQYVQKMEMFWIINSTEIFRMYN